MNATVRVVTDRIAHITVDNPPVNTITYAVRTGLNATLDRIEQDPDVQAVVISCAGRTFFSGADINEFDGPPREDEYRQLFARLERFPVPVIAAMHGTIMGGGLELALACHFRLASETARFSFPEVTLGILPGAGGTQRLPRLIGLERALDMIVSAALVSAADGMEMGFIDHLSSNDLQADALQFARRIIEEARPMRRTGTLDIEGRAAAAELAPRYRALAREKYPNRKAALMAVEAVLAASRLDFEAGLTEENRLVNLAKQSTEAKAQIRLFFAERNTTKVPWIAESVSPENIKSAAIIGAGTMGTGIAICFANAGIPVTLIDLSENAVNAGLERIDAMYASRVKRKRMSEEDKRKAMALIRTATSIAAASGADLFIEAVFEDLDLKQSVFRELDRVAGPNAILATNTSTLDIDRLASVTRRQDRVLGLHFFSPANVMPLLEVVHTETTSPQTIRTALALAKPLRKVPVLAKVCYGFIGNRMMEGYGREAELMTLEGVPCSRIDQVLRDFGMAMGILSVFDLAGVDVGVNIRKAHAERFAHDPTYYQASQVLVEHGRLGMKSGAGFYAYAPGERSGREDPVALELIRQRGRALGIIQREDHRDEEILERCLYPLINEALQILYEGIALRASDIDVVWTSGYGFPRYRGGPLFYGETLGLDKVLHGILQYRDRFGNMHWQPSPLLEELVSKNLSIGEWEALRFH